jgi:hypothetical protein
VLTRRPLAAHVAIRLAFPERFEPRLVFERRIPFVKIGH